MTAETIGSAEVVIEANFNDFDATVQRRLVAAAQRAGAAAEKELKRSGDRGGKAFSEGVSKAASSTKTLDGIRSSVERLEAASVRAGDAQTDAANKVARAEAALAKVKRTTSTVTLDGAEKIIVAEERVAKAKRDAARADNLVTKTTETLSAARAKLAVEAEKPLDLFGGSGGSGGRKNATKAGDDAGNFFSRAFRAAAARGIGRGLFTALIASAGGLVTALSPLSTLLGGGAAAVVALVGALAQASGAALSLGGVLASLGLAAITLKVGFSGIGDAMKAQSKAQQELARTGAISKTTQEKLDAALKNLAPSAAAVVKQLGAMAPAWQAVQRSIQERLFTGVATTLAALGNRFLPILNQQLGTAAGTLNQTTRSLAGFLSTSGRAGQINTIFGNLNGILRTLLGPLNTVTAGFLDIFTASLPFARQLATVLSSIGVDFGKWLSQVAASGAFNSFMQTAMQLAGNLFQLLGNIGSIIGSVFGAGTAAGGGLLLVLRNLTGAAAQFLKSSEGQAALASFFGLISQAGAVLVNTFRTLQPLLSGIGSLFSSLQGPIKIFGAALTGVIGQLAVTLGGALTQLGPILGQLVIALAPVVTILGTVLNGALQALIPVVLQIVTAFGQLVPVLAPLVAIIGTALVDTLTQASGIMVQIVPVLAQFIAALAVGLQPILAAIQPVLAQLVTAFVQLIQALLPILVSLLPLVPAFSQLSLASTQLILALSPLITSVLGTLSSQLIQLAPIIEKLVPPLVDLTFRFANVIAMVARVIAVVSNFVAQMLGKLNTLRGNAITIVGSMISSIVGFFQSLPGRVTGALSSLVSAVSGVIQRVVAFFQKLPGQIVGALSGLGGSLRNAGSQAMSGLIGGLEGALGKVRSVAGEIAKAITGPVAKFLQIRSPSRVMYALGSDAGQGFADGFFAKLKAVSDAAKAVAGAVPDAVLASIKKLSTSLNALKLPASIQKKLGSLTSAAQSQLASIGVASDALDKKLKTAQANLQSLLEKSNQLAQSVAQSILQTGNIAQGQDQSFAGIVGRLQTAVTQARQFSSVITALTKSGLNKTSLQQILDAGPEAGLAAGQAILNAGQRGVQRINTLQQQLQVAANRAAKTASDAIFGQGIQIANGIVAGLQNQKVALDKQMLRLADVLVARVLQVLRGVKLKSGGTLSIPGFADGGVVGRDSIIRVAERDRKEAIVPLTKPRRAQQIMDATGLSALASGGSKSRTVEVPIHVAGNLVDYDALTKHIEGVLIRFGFKPVLGLKTVGGTL